MVTPIWSRLLFLFFILLTTYQAFCSFAFPVLSLQIGLHRPHREKHEKYVLSLFIFPEPEEQGKKVMTIKQFYPIQLQSFPYAGCLHKS